MSIENAPFKPSGVSAELIAMVETPAGDRFALAKKTGLNEHITWGVGADGSCFWGHYGLTFEEGLADLAGRAAGLVLVGVYDEDDEVDLEAALASDDGE
jgi:hypothetical protein